MGGICSSSSRFHSKRSKRNGKTASPAPGLTEATSSAQTMPSGVGNVEDEGILRGPIREVEAARQKLAANQGKEDEKKKKAWRSTGKDLNSDAGNAQASTTPEYWSKYNPGTRPEREEELKLMGFDARKYQ